jgi:tRNA(Ile)-lysidine synthase
MITWTDIEHQIWTDLKIKKLDQDSIYLLAVSGGLDSMALLAVFAKIKPTARFVVMHYHHGPGVDSVFRDRCVDLIKSQVSLMGHKCVFESETSDVELKSEAELRVARQNFFEKIKNKYNVSYYLTAHHQDDVLETRLLKLIRGAGTVSLNAFKDWNKLIYRPFFQITKKDLNTYADMHNLKWIEDPSNSETYYLRNWLRNEWLPALDAKMSGAVGGLSQSLQNILNESDFSTDLLRSEIENHVVFATDTVTINQLWFLGLNTKDQLSVLIRILRQHQIMAVKSDFTTNQLKEVLRRLDKNQNEHIFQVAGINWVINTKHIVLSCKQKIRDGLKHES